jgi:hypothetical protein
MIKDHPCVPVPARSVDSDPRRSVGRDPKRSVDRNPKRSERDRRRRDHFQDYLSKEPDFSKSKGIIEQGGLPSLGKIGKIGKRR